MKQRFMVTLAVAAAFSVAADAQESVTPKNNPAPRHGYEITWRFEAPPGPMPPVLARAEYEVANIDCVPVDHARALGGVRLRPHHSMRLELRQAANGELNSTVHGDALQTEDYFHLGPCHWELHNVHFEFRSPNHGVPFVAALAPEKLSRNGVVTWRYLVSDFYAAPPSPITGIHGEAKSFYPSSKPQFALVATIRQIPN
jgi:hypothetical protein